MKHTPGPWAVIPPDEYCKSWFISRDRLGAPVGTVPRHLRDGLPYFICVFGQLMSSERAESNARLIAAAPELLEMCKAALRTLDDLNSQYHIYGRDNNAADGVARKLISIIAKATGEP